MPLKKIMSVSPHVLPQLSHKTYKIFKLTTASPQIPIYCVRMSKRSHPIYLLIARAIESELDAFIKNKAPHFCQLFPHGHIVLNECFKYLFHEDSSHRLAALEYLKAYRHLNIMDSTKYGNSIDSIVRLAACLSTLDQEEKVANFAWGLIKAEPLYDVPLNDFEHYESRYEADSHSVETVNCYARSFYYFNKLFSLYDSSKNKNSGLKSPRMSSGSRSPKSPRPLKFSHSGGNLSRSNSFQRSGSASPFSSPRLDFSDKSKRKNIAEDHIFEFIKRMKKVSRDWFSNKKDWSIESAYKHGPRVSFSLAEEPVINKVHKNWSQKVGGSPHPLAYSYPYLDNFKKQ